MVFESRSRGSNSLSKMGKSGICETRYWENEEVKSPRQKKSKVEPLLQLKSIVAKKIELTIEEETDDMKLSSWRVM